jgi:uncharacterized protein
LLTSITRTGPGAAARAWYREPFLWLVLGIPLLTVVAGLTTVVIANVGADPVVADEFRNDGLAINRDPARDRAAAAAGAVASIDADGSWLTVRLALARGDAPAQLVVLLSHAARADFDRMLRLERRADGGYEAPLAALPAGHWFVEVAPPDRAWRLTGDFSATPRALVLRPGPAA